MEWSIKMKRLLKAEFFKLSKEWSLWPLMLFSMVDGYLDGAVPVRYDVMITGYEMYVMRLLAGLRYEVLVCVFAAAFVYSDSSEARFFWQRPQHIFQESCRLFCCISVWQQRWQYRKTDGEYR